MDHQPIMAGALSSEPTVGSNMKGEASGAGWLYALPRLSYEHVVCVGAPAVPTLAGLARAGSSVVVLEAVGRRRRRLEALVRERNWTGVDVRTPDARPADPVDLLVVTRAATARTWAGAAARAHAAALSPSGVTYLDRGRAGFARTPDATLDLALTPARGEVRSAIPEADRETASAFTRLRLHGTLARRGRLVRVERALDAQRLGRWLGRRAARVRLPDDGSDRAAVPRYLRDVASGCGVDLDGWRWGVSARGDYDSQKVLVLLTPPGADEPTVLAKVTRSAAHAPRLENEARALTSLYALPLSTGRVPTPCFSGVHAGRAILGQSMLPGGPFAAASDWGPDCPRLLDALSWLTGLATVTAQLAPAAAVGEVLLTMLDRYEAVYRPEPDEAATLRRHFSGLAGLGVAVPTVFQHGDPHPGNLLVDARGHTGFLDWESAESRGLPLWDLLYFFRSYAIEAERRSGVRDRVDAARRHLLGASTLSERLVEAAAAQVGAAGVPPAAVEPLVLGCWLHRALKEATRVTPAALGRGQSVRLLRLMLAEPAAPTLARLRRIGL